MSGSELNRREALRALGAAGAGALAVPALLAAEAAAQSATPAPGAKPEPAPMPEADKPKEPSLEAQRLGDVARERYGQYLDDAQMKELVADIDGNVQSGARLRKERLKNSDEPDFVFRA